MSRAFHVLLVLTLLSVSPSVTMASSFSYNDYAAVLDAYVDNEGFVNYAGLQKNRLALDRFADAMSKLGRDEFESWTEPQRMAFWINAYNALTLVLIIDRYPIQSSRIRGLVWPKNSIRQIPGAWTDVEFDVMGAKVTLDHVEHGILRTDFAEPRIHMALVCAARSCPNLRREPYRGGDLDAQLADQTLVFLADPDKFILDKEGAKVRISAIFDWFKGDFLAKYGGTEREGMGARETAVINFIAAHADEDARDFLLSGKLSIEYSDYDWTLNER